MLVTYRGQVMGLLFHTVPVELTSSFQLDISISSIPRHRLPSGRSAMFLTGELKKKSHFLLLNSTQKMLCWMRSKASP